mmetsp:Transcript_3103/g.5756  ORF Transcript_3103/g.5756 Transcript_3103/m.5756 type:complete len:261 (+) Transcript_3103:831-1613(+)
MSFSSSILISSTHSDWTTLSLSSSYQFFTAGNILTRAPESAACSVEISYCLRIFSVASGSATVPNWIIPLRFLAAFVQHSSSSVVGSSVWNQTSQYAGDPMTFGSKVSASSAKFFPALEFGRGNLPMFGSLGWPLMLSGLSPASPLIPSFMPFLFFGLPATTTSSGRMSPGLRSSQVSASPLLGRSGSASSSTGKGSTVAFPRLAMEIHLESSGALNEPTYWPNLFFLGYHTTVRTYSAIGSPKASSSHWPFSPESIQPK